MMTIDQVCLLQPVDKARVAIAGLSAGASVAFMGLLRWRATHRLALNDKGSRKRPLFAGSWLTTITLARGGLMDVLHHAGCSSALRRLFHSAALAWPWWNALAER